MHYSAISKFRLNWSFFNLLHLNADRLTEMGVFRKWGIETNHSRSHAIDLIAFRRFSPHVVRVPVGNFKEVMEPALNLTQPPRHVFDFQDLFVSCFHLMSTSKFRTKLGLIAFSILTGLFCRSDTVPVEHHPMYPENHICFRLHGRLTTSRGWNWIKDWEKCFQDGQYTMKCNIYYWADDLQQCPEIVRARFFHESAHAIRWLQALQSGKFFCPLHNLTFRRPRINSSFDSTKRFPLYVRWKSARLWLHHGTSIFSGDYDPYVWLTVFQRWKTATADPVLWKNRP
jgi:hypothetical protein